MGAAHSRKDDDSYSWTVDKSPPRDISGPLGPVSLYASDFPEPNGFQSATGSAADKRKPTGIKTKVIQAVGRAGTAGFVKAVDALDTIGSSMTNLHLGGSGFPAAVASKNNKIGILAFEVANTIAKGYNLKVSLSEDRIQYLKEVILCSEGVQRLVSANMKELLSIAAADKKKELMVLAKEVVRFGNQCREPQWHHLDRYFDRLGKDILGPGQNRDEIEEEVQRMVVWAQQTAELYHEWNSLDRFEAEIRRKFQDEELFSNYSKGDSLSALRGELKSRGKNVKSLKRKSLWSKTLEEVVEKLVDAVNYLHFEIEHAFGDATKNTIAKEDNERLGPLGLALHYAGIISQIDGLVSRPGSVPVDARDTLYQSLPPTIKTMLRQRLPMLRMKRQFTISHVKEELEKTLAWLVPIATNTTKAHHGFGWVGEWANTGSYMDMGPSGQTCTPLIQTMHHAQRKATEECILELLVLLHYLVCLAQDDVVEFKPLTLNVSPYRKVEPIEQELRLAEKHIELDTSNMVVPPGVQDQDVLSQDLEFRPELRLSQDFDRKTNNGDSSRSLTKNSSHSSTRSVEEVLSPSACSHGHLLPVIDFGVNRVKSLDVIDRVDDI